MDDQPPKVWFEPIETYDGKKLYMMDYYRTKILTMDDINQLLDNYYDERGWDIKLGIPTADKLRELELEELIPELEELKCGLS